jgi:hypothetical protein
MTPEQKDLLTAIHLARYEFYWGKAQAEKDGMKRWPKTDKEWNQTGHGAPWDANVEVAKDMLKLGNRLLFLQLIGPKARFQEIAMDVNKEVEKILSMSDEEIEAEADKDGTTAAERDLATRNIMMGAICRILAKVEAERDAYKKFVQLIAGEVPTPDSISEFRLGGMIFYGVTAQQIVEAALVNVTGLAHSTLETFRKAPEE